MTDDTPAGFCVLFPLPEHLGRCQGDRLSWAPTAFWTFSFKTLSVRMHSVCWDRDRQGMQAADTSQDTGMEVLHPALKKKSFLGTRKCRQTVKFWFGGCATSREESILIIVHLVERSESNIGRIPLRKRYYTFWEDLFHSVQGSQGGKLQRYIQKPSRPHSSGDL